MSREKQIEEMAKAVCHLDRTCEECMTSFECKAMMYAKRFYNEGYRKSSDVAREIFEEIEKSISDLEYQAKTPRKTVKVEELKAQCDWILHEVIPKTLAELKKKYTESEDTE